MQDTHYSQLKNLFVERREAFKMDVCAQDELRAYERGDDSYEYTVLWAISSLMNEYILSIVRRKGFVPRVITGNALAGGGIAYKKSDTFFTVSLIPPITWLDWWDQLS